jgi:AraC-like DNA-binding protein
MSERSLQRKLTDEGLTFQGLLSKTRHELAFEYLSDSSLEIAEVAHMVGYEDQNSFFRGFRQWEDKTPSVWPVRARSMAGRSRQMRPGAKRKSLELGASAGHGKKTAALIDAAR